jgi:hypothetical protein
MSDSSERLSETAAPLTFSILLETANLSVRALPNLRECLQTLDEQDISPRRANEVLLLDSGQIPHAMLDQLTRAFPWLTPCPLEANADYGVMKARSAVLATADVVLLCDSDCRFPPRLGEEDARAVSGARRRAHRRR